MPQGHSKVSLFKKKKKMIVEDFRRFSHADLFINIFEFLFYFKETKAANSHAPKRCMG